MNNTEQFPGTEELTPRIGNAMDDAINRIVEREILAKLETVDLESVFPKPTGNAMRDATNSGRVSR